MIVECQESICISVLDWLPERMSPAFERLLGYWPRNFGTPCDGMASRRNTIIWAAIAKSRAQPSAALFVYILRILRGAATTRCPFAIVTNFSIGASRQPAGGCGRVAAGPSRQARSQRARTSVAANAPGFLRAGHGWAGTLRIAQCPTRATMIGVHSKAPHDPTENARPVTPCAKGQAHVFPQSPPSREGLVDVGNHATENMARSTGCELSGCRGQAAASPAHQSGKRPARLGKLLPHRQGGNRVEISTRHDLSWSHHDQTQPRDTRKAQ
jgi:hypothetical protein